MTASRRVLQVRGGVVVAVVVTGVAGYAVFVRQTRLRRFILA